MMNWAFIGVGGFLGANFRFIIGNLAKKYFHGHFPLGTFFVNLLGSFLLGLLFALSREGSGSIYSFLGIGFMGAFTTFSTMNVEGIQLIVEGRTSISILYLGATYFFGICLAFVGFYFGVK